MKSAPGGRADDLAERIRSGKFIKLESARVHEDAALFRVSYSEYLSRYLTTGLFYVKYDFPLDAVPPSILSIPLLGCLVPLGWLTGAGVGVQDVDARYLNSLPLMGQELKRMYPGIAFSARIEGNPVETGSEWNPGKYCLLYSGGVDSTSSLIRNFEKKPSLITVRGVPDLRLHEDRYWNRVKERIQPFITSLGLESHIVETNAIDMVNLATLNADYRAQLPHGWWEDLAHGLFFLSICAPYTYHNHIGGLMIASSHTKRDEKPWGSSPTTDEKIGWGSIRVIHDSYDLHRVDKIRQVLIPFIESRGAEIPLRVCTGKRGIRLASGQLNCGQCEKCMLIELILTVSGADASESGFDISPASLLTLRHNLEAGQFGSEFLGFLSWKFIRRNIGSAPSEVVDRHPGLRAFLDWLADWDERPTKKRRRYLNKVAPPSSRRRDVARAMLGKKEKLTE